ncbi:MAG: hypothetical protein Q8R92_06815, partial [Deltaproteobacteria bacterium]|nr:hypothetical protein [Deltaproteobacteria bacterium]
MSASRQQVAIVIASMLSVAAWSSTVALLVSWVFVGSWVGYWLALAVNLPVGALIGWRLDRQMKRETRRWEDLHA